MPPHRPIIRSDEGFVHLGFQKLDDKNFRAILMKLRTPCRERRPRKCRRLNSIGHILSMLPSKVVYFNVVGNKRIGDAGTEHLHLLPNTVTDLDLSDCGITVQGIRNICEYMKTNTSIQRLIMWGNAVGDEGAGLIADMLRENKTLRILCIMGSRIGVEGFSHISRGLAHNKTLETIFLGNDQKVGDEHIRRLCPGLAVNQGLKILDLGGAGVTNKGLEPIEVALRENYHLRNIRLNQPMHEEDYIKLGPGTTWRKICSWMALNGLNRKVLLQDEDVSMSKWHEILLNAHKGRNVNALFYFLRCKPELCQTFASFEAGEC
ncbi:NLR family, CARD domain containing 3 [Seminavis robusta]|uniref:NLR family, CARD domain containing 3 n=1 Tax=Seminavis robusta TaxID=568900 RepID=A0A9N8HDP7_9STRA|nr:NLR family, CARD domain containing 3 [Seminavis robusta]|eukprot:Sro436_g142680.1 NLR family, CARD domain containing 3 (320) ;mRNA; f:41905-42864